MDTQTIQAILERLEEKVNSIDHTLRGNGHPGLTTRMSHVEESIKGMRWWYRWIFTAIFGFILGIASKVFVHG